MKAILTLLSSACLSLIALTAGNPLDQPFDSYGDIPWEEEKAHLDNFAVALRRDPDLVGYIVVYAGRRACSGEARERAERATKYVVETRGIEGGRIKWLDGGHREEMTVVLQPAPRGAPVLEPSPTVAPGDVQIEKDCGRRREADELKPTE